MTMTDPILRMTPEERHIEHQRRADEGRSSLRELPPLPTAVEVVTPIVQALSALHDLRERVEAHADILGPYEFTDVNDDDWRAAGDLLALQHEIADLLALDISGWVPGRAPSLGAAFRAVAYDAMNTHDLVDACRHPQLEALRMSG